jgi:hypothetical protein
MVRGVVERGTVLQRARYRDRGRERGGVPEHLVAKNKEWMGGGRGANK